MSEEHKPTLAQKTARLDYLMDEKAPPTIYSTKLTPELSEAALNLTIDFQRQKQTGATMRLIKHPYTFAIIAAAFGVFSTWTLGQIVKDQGLRELKYQLDKVISVIVFTTMFTCVVFHLLNRQTEVIRDNADKIAESSEGVFGFNIREFAAVKAGAKVTKKEREMLDKAENTSIVVYRDTPIAVISLVPVPALSNKEKFVTKITGAGIRKVYQRSGIIEDLLDWAVYRSGVLNNSKSPKILVCIEVLSTDSDLKKVLKAKQFQFLEDRPLSGSQVLALYGIKNEIWGLPLNVSKLSDAEVVKSKAGSTGAKRKA
ncbi:Inorganic phosphate transporter PHO86 [Cyberlindnera fabianii]|uniref:Inorganic phosphate transporter PHO86 n=1 Tax=Cyberlindnera fabianii TaxID=36022 RepID=A0A1V2L8K5_CYBFA|nr:Inorganic phosphate transporter PHO86 [Cyberlindnera fabianii]